MLRQTTVYDEIIRSRNAKTAAPIPRRETVSPPSRNGGIRSAIRLYLPVVIAVLLPVFFLVLFRCFRNNQLVVNRFIRFVTTPYKQTAARLCSRLPFSMAELIWTLAVLFLLILILRSLFIVIRSAIQRAQGRKTHPLRRLIRRSLAILAVGLIIYSGYTATWGVNYYGETFSQMSGLQPRGCTRDELGSLTLGFANKCNQLSDQVARDEQGHFLGQPDTLFVRSNGLYTRLYPEFPCLDLEENQARPMFYSRLISYLGFTGFYFPFTGESLVNVDAPACLVPSTILHELAHQRNVASEAECNFLAIIAGLRSDDPEFQYSSALLGYIHLSNALYSTDRSLWKDIQGALNDQVRTDLGDNSAYWAKFQTPASDAAEAVYTSFAASYEQEDIMKSYGECVDLLAAYFISKE